MLTIKESKKCLNEDLQDYRMNRMMIVKEYKKCPNEDLQDERMNRMMAIELEKTILKILKSNKS